MIRCAEVAPAVLWFLPLRAICVAIVTGLDIDPDGSGRPTAVVLAPARELVAGLWLVDGGAPFSRNVAQLALTCLGTP